MNVVEALGDRTNINTYLLTQKIKFKIFYRYIKLQIV